MSHESFFVSTANPNDVSGGGGCLCSPSKVADCTGPYVLWPAADMESYLSPHTVVGIKCLKAAAKVVDGESLSASEVSPVDAVVAAAAEEDRQVNRKVATGKSRGPKQRD